MSFLILPDKFNPLHVHFGPLVKNNDSDGVFSRIIYSTKDIALNGVGIMFDLNETTHESHYNKMYITFDPDAPTNSNTVLQLQTIEIAILEKYAGHVTAEPRRCVHSLANQLKTGCIKTHAHAASSDDNFDIDHHVDSSTRCVMLKICGVWESKGECGILYKFANC